MKFKIRILKSQLEDWYCWEEGKIYDVKFYSFNPEEFYQTIDSSTFAPELIRISDCEVVPEPEQVKNTQDNSAVVLKETGKLSKFEQALSLVEQMEVPDRIQLFDKIKLIYNLK